MLIQNVKLFLSALALSCKVADQKSSMPALATVRLQNTAGVCRVVSTDLYVTLISTVPVAEDTGTDCAVNAKGLATAVKKLGSDTGIDLAMDAGKLVIRSGARKLALSTFPVADLPAEPSPTSRGIDLDKPAFTRALSYVESMASQDETRQHLSVVHTELDGATVKLVSTDGHRLALTSVTGTGGGTDGTVELPAPAARVILDVCKASNGAAPVCRLGFFGDLSTFTCGPHTVIAKNQDTRFPPYERVIPGYHDLVVRTDAGAVYEAMDLAKAMAEKGSNYGAAISFRPEAMVIGTEAVDTGTTSEEVPVSYDKGEESDRDLKVGFNADYFLDALKGRTGAITLGLGRDLDPCVVRFDADPDTFCVIMPLRL
jgi:DNA polymerase III subunit beta